MAKASTSNSRTSPSGRGATDVEYYPDSWAIEQTYVPSIQIETADRFDHPCGFVDFSKLKKPKPRIRIKATSRRPIVAKYRKKPVVIDAIHTSIAIHLSAKDFWGLPDWLIKAYDNGDIVFCPDKILVKTLEGTMQADRTDMLICGVKGEIYPCKPDIFAATYELVEDQ